MPFCPSCGKGIPSDARFCPKCGSQIGPSQDLKAPLEKGSFPPRGELGFWASTFGKKCPACRNQGYLRLTRKELLSRKPGYDTRILRTRTRDQDGEAVSTIGKEVRVPVMRTRYRSHYLCTNPRCQKASYIDTVEVHEQDTETTIRHVSLDFSSLKEAMGKGGIQMTTYKCPQCGGALTLPDSGKLLTCRHCGTVVKPVDVFEKIKDLL